MGIHVTAFSPLGHGASYWKDEISTLREPIVQNLAKKHGVSEAQIVLRFGIERGISVIPKSNNPERIKQNIELFEFKLSEEDMTQLYSLERNLRFNDPSIFHHYIIVITFSFIFDIHHHFRYWVGCTINISIAGRNMTVRIIV